MPDTATRADRADATLALLQFATLTETHLADLAGLTAADLADMLAAADATRADRWPAAARLILDTLEARAARADGWAPSRSARAAEHLETTRRLVEIGAHPLRRSITPRDERAARRLAATPLLLQVAARTADHERIMPAEIGAQRALWPLLEHLEDDERWGADAWAILRDGTRTAQREAEAARTGARRQINLDAAEVLADAVRAVAYAQRIDA